MCVTQPATVTDQAQVRERLDRAFQVVAGKGGVGRTLVSSALAMRSAAAGERTLLLEANAPDNAARYLGVDAVIDEPREVLDNLWLCRMTPAGALREYALLILRFKALYNLVFENRLVKYFLRSIPSLAEFTMMGKAWYHSTETRKDGSLRFTRVVLDAPATGHAITLLGLSRIVADVVPAGVMKTAAEKMAAVIESPTSSCLHLVATPEEMPVNEAIELAAAQSTRLRMTSGVGIVNRRFPAVLRPGEAELIARLPSDPALAPYLAAVARRRELEAVQAEHAERFARTLSRPILTIDELPASLTPIQQVERVRRVLAVAAGDAR